MELFKLDKNGDGTYTLKGLTDKTVTSVIIPDNVKVIGSAAFYGCNNLTSVIIPNGVESIGEIAFEHCRKLTSITIPESVKRIEHDAFANCVCLENIMVSKNNTAYHSAENCIIETATKTLAVGCKNSVIPSDGSVEFIGDSALYATAFIL